MLDRLSGLAYEFRYMRASVLVGAVIVAFGALAYCARPEARGPIFGARLEELVSAIGKPGVWVAALFAVVLVGGWWCDFAVATLSCILRLALRGIPFDQQVSSWGVLERVRCPLARRDVAILQRKMEGISRYQDLDFEDRAFAFRMFLRDCMQWSRGEIFSLGDEVGETSLIRRLTDVRLSCGLIPWMPLFFIALALNVRAEHGGIRVALFAGAGIVLFVLLGTLLVEVRAASAQIVHAAASNTELERCAGAAVDASRDPLDIERALDEIG
ncbi:hypothetical protein [Luteipulveratus halotolerans]|uniref:hypothetical protein n=1 Tax=Luteipulveratus halotolerans TaxID=1631356 RepID=UPI0012FC2E85|nr:hypothetical protein [Luteipulveratus halotolerans]